MLAIQGCPCLKNGCLITRFNFENWKQINLYPKRLRIPFQPQQTTLPHGAEIKIPGVGATPVAVSTTLPAAVVQLSQQGKRTFYFHSLLYILLLLLGFRFVFLTKHPKRSRSWFCFSSFLSIIVLTDKMIQSKSLIFLYIIHSLWVSAPGKFSSFVSLYDIFVRRWGDDRNAGHFRRLFIFFNFHF